MPGQFLPGDRRLADAAHDAFGVAEFFGITQHVQHESLLFGVWGCAKGNKVFPPAEGYLADPIGAGFIKGFAHEGESFELRFVFRGHEVGAVVEQRPDFFPFARSSKELSSTVWSPGSFRESNQSFWEGVSWGGSDKIPQTSKVRVSSIGTAMEKESHRTALQRFIVGKSDLAVLESLSRRFNIFESLGAVHNERRHSSFLGFLLNPKANHGLATC